MNDIHSLKKNGSGYLSPPLHLEQEGVTEVERLPPTRVHQHTLIRGADGAKHPPSSQSAENHHHLSLHPTESRSDSEMLKSSSSY